MNCPGCSTQMQKGFFANCDVPIQWIPEGEKYPKLRGRKADGAVVFGEGNFFKGYRAEAWYCPRCCMAIVPGK